MYVIHLFYTGAMTGSLHTRSGPSLHQSSQSQTAPVRCSRPPVAIVQGGENDCGPKTMAWLCMAM